MNETNAHTGRDINPLNVGRLYRFLGKIYKHSIPLSRKEEPSNGDRLCPDELFVVLESEETGVYGFEPDYLICTPTGKVGWVTLMTFGHDVV